MILEAFAEFMHTRPDLPAQEALSVWLWDNLKQAPSSRIEKIIHMEIGIVLVLHQGAGNKPVQAPTAPTAQTGSIIKSLRLPEEAERELSRDLKISLDIPCNSHFVFKGASASGARLLNSLWEYSMSYEQQRWSRFVHSLKASDFKISRDT